MKIRFERIPLEDMGVVYTWLAIAALVAAASFLAGVDNSLDKVEEAQRAPTREDRIRIYCAMPDHVEHLCQQWRKEKEKAAPVVTPPAPPPAPPPKQVRYFIQA